MAEAESGKGPIVEVNNQVNLPGESVDKAAADLLRTALGAPAEETSGLFVDLIGIAGDRVKLYRAEKRIQILSDARQRLAERGVALQGASVPIEGLVYDAIEGMASAHTDDLADMWAGLMANALDPNKAISLEQSYISTIRSLSSDDALSLDFMFARHEFEHDVSDIAKSYAPFREWPVPKTTISAEARSELLGRISSSVEVLVGRYSETEMRRILDSSYGLLNLYRLGLVLQDRASEHNHFTDVNKRLQHEDFQIAFDELAGSELAKDLRRTDVMFAVSAHNGQVLKIPVGLTPFAVQLGHACDRLEVRSKPKSDKSDL